MVRVPEPEGILGGAQSLEAYLSFHGVESIEEIGADLQLTLFVRARHSNPPVGGGLRDGSERELLREPRAATG